MKVFFLPIFLSLLLVSCNNESQQKIISKSEFKTDTVRVFILTQAKIEKQTTLPGELLSYEQADIHPKVAGYIKEMKVDIGSVVRKGQVLAVIDAPEIQSKLAEAGSKMQAAEAKYEASKNTYDRILEASRSDGVIAPDELQRAKNQMLADSADYRASSYSSRSSKQIGNYLMIIAPFSGTITERNVNVGAFVGTANEKPIVVIADNSRLRLRVAVPEVLSSAQIMDNKINFSTRSSPNQTFEGKLARRTGSIDVSTRTEIWEFEIDNKKNVLKPGSFADVKMNVVRDKPGFLIPFSAVVTTLEKKFIIKVSRNTTQWVDVSQGMNLIDKTEVFGNLKVGDTIVTKGNEELKAGLKVTAKLSN
jgi:RND family efflux transporter MFP subunit